MQRDILLVSHEPGEFVEVFVPQAAPMESRFFLLLSHIYKPWE